MEYTEFFFVTLNHTDAAVYTFNEQSTVHVTVEEDPYDGLLTLSSPYKIQNCIILFIYNHVYH